MQNERAKRNIEIRARYRAGGITQSQLAREYGISANRVGQIIQNRKYWMDGGQNCENIQEDDLFRLFANKGAELGCETLIVRCYNCMRLAGYNNPSSLIGIKYDDIIAIRNCGDKSARFIVEVARQVENGTAV